MFSIPVESSHSGKSSSKDGASIAGLPSGALEGTLDVLGVSRPARPATFASLLASQSMPRTTGDALAEESADAAEAESAEPVEETPKEPKPNLVARNPMRKSDPDEQAEPEADSDEGSPEPVSLEIEPTPVEPGIVAETEPAPASRPQITGGAVSAVPRDSTGQGIGTRSETILPSTRVNEIGESGELGGEVESDAFATIRTTQSKEETQTASVSIGYGDAVIQQSNATRAFYEPNVVARPITTEADSELEKEGEIVLEGLESDESVEIDPELLKRMSKGASVVAQNPVVTPHTSTSRSIASETQATTAADESEAESEEQSAAEVEFESGGEEGSPDRQPRRERESRQFAQGRDAEPARPSTAEPARVVRTARESEILSRESRENHVEMVEDVDGDTDGTSAAQEGSRMAESQNKPILPSTVNDALSGESARIETARDGKESGAATVTSAQEVNAARPVMRAEAGSVVTVPSTYEAAVANAERISRMIVRETAVLRQSGADSMTAILRPDAQTEMVVNMRRVDGTMEATIKVERGDFAGLGQQWSQLQDRLAQQNIRLAPLEEAPSRFESGTREEDARSGNSGQADDNPTHTRRAANIERGSGSGESAETKGNSDDVQQPSDGRSKWETWA